MTTLAAPLTPVRPGTAESLARLSFFRELEQIQPEELDEVALFLLGNVGAPTAGRELWLQLRPDCLRLWHLVTDDWDEDDLDDLDDRDWFPGMTVEQAEGARYGRTRERLASEIESAVWLARYRAVEARRTAVAS